MSTFVRQRQPSSAQILGMTEEELAEREQEEWEIVGDSIDPQELRSLHALRDAVRDCDNHAACRRKPLSRQAQTLLRFLRGREGNVSNAEVMFRKTLEWRASFMVDEKVELWRGELAEARTPRSELLQRYGCHVEMCPDLYGVPVSLMRVGVADLAGIVREVGRDVLLIHSLSLMEKTHDELRNAMFRERRVLRGQVQIIDIGDYKEHGPGAWWTRMQQGLKEGPPIFKVFDDNYPETARKVFLIRLGTLATGMYRVVRPIVPARTQRKLRFFGGKAADWVEELKAEVPHTEELPLFLQEDTSEAFAAAEPRGGLVPKGAGRGTVEQKSTSKMDPKGDGGGQKNLLNWALAIVLVLVSLAPELCSMQARAQLYLKPSFPTLVDGVQWLWQSGSVEA